MKIENQKVVTLTYEMYVEGEKEGELALIEKMTAEAPLTYCHGEGMMLPAWEKQMEGRAEGDEFEFTIPCAEAYGEYDEAGVLELDKKLFYNGDGEFDDERVYEGAIVPMNTADGQVIKAQIAEIGENTVTIDLNHPYAGENLTFKGKILSIRDVTDGELKALHHRGCGGCGGGCHGGNCGNGEGCKGGCGNCGE